MYYALHEFYRVTYNSQILLMRNRRVLHRYALIVDGKGAVTERKLANHGPGTVLTPSVTVVSSTAAGGRRTVVLTRNVTGATSDHYSIPKTAGEINLITAIGNSVEIAYHASRTGAKFVLLPKTVTACVCDPETTGYLT